MPVRPFLALSLSLFLAGGAPLAAAHAAPAPAPAAPRDGAHDFDFHIGKWRTHIRRVLDPLSGGTHSVVMDGTVTTHRLWSGPNQAEEIEADGPHGAHLEGMTLFLYDPAGSQWSQAFAGAQSSTIDAPMIGAFKDGRAELIGADVVDKRTVLLRGVWSNITPTTHHFEEDYSADGGRTWVPAFLADLTKISD